MHCRAILWSAALGLWAGPARGAGTFSLEFRGPASIGGARGSTQTADYLCFLTGTGGGPGAQGWTLGITAEGASIVEIDIQGTATERFLANGSARSEITTGAGNVGAVSVVVLSLTDPAVALPADSSLPVARIRVSTTIGSSCGTATLRYTDGLRSRGGNPIFNRVSAGGAALTPLLHPQVTGIVPQGVACPDLNPSGWIRTSGWSLLFPLTNPYGCGAGGAEVMLGNWVAPHDLTLESPRPGSRWGDIDFGGRALATGFEAADLHAAREPGLDPVVWVTLADIARFPGANVDTPILLERDGVDFQAIVDFFNSSVTPKLVGYVPLMLSDNVLGVARSYVENRTAAPVCVGACTTSDDSIQVWVNDRLAVNLSACQGQAEDCAGGPLAVLEPGINTVTVLNWEGGGLWGFRLALVDETGRKLSNHNQEDIIFHGAAPPRTPAAPAALAVTRSTAQPDSCPAPNPTRVRLRGNGKGSGSAELVEVYRRSEVNRVLNLSHGGTAAVADPFLVLTWRVPVSVLNTTGVTYDVELAPGGSASPTGQVNACAAIGGASEVMGSWPHSGPRGVFEDSHDIGSREALQAGAGDLAALAGVDGELATADDIYTLRGSGSDVWNEGDSFHFAYRRVSGDFEAQVRIAGRAFPPSGGRWGRYGLMVRQSCSPDSRYSLVNANLEADPGPGADHPRGDAVFWQFRRLHGVAASSDASQSLLFPDPDGGGPQLINQPNFFRLRRRGRTFTGYASFDGVSWKLVGSNTWRGLAADEELLVGFMHSKHSSASSPGTVTFTDFRIGPLPRAEVFDNDAGSPGRVVYQQNFNAVPNGGLPAGMVPNCASGCAVFTPRVVNGRLRLTQEGAFGNATSVFLPDVPLPAASGKLIIEYTVYVSHSGVTGHPVQGDPNPGDGVTLAVVAGRNGRRVGGPGGAMGYDGLTRRAFADAAPSFAVEYDCWAGGGDNEGSGSPNADGGWHLAINTSGNVHSVAMQDAGLPDIFAARGVPHRVELTSEGRISVFLPGAGGGGPPASEPVLEGEGEPLVSQGDREAELGLTGGTGAASQTAEVDDLRVIVEGCTDNPETARVAGPASASPASSVLLDARGSSTGAGDAADGETLTFAWRIASGADKARLDLVNDPLGTAVLFVIEDGEVVVGVTVDDGHCERPLSATATHRLVVREGNWITYDANDDGKVDISDAVTHLGFLFLGGARPGCLDALNVNGDALNDISDAVAALGFLFLAAPPPPQGTGCQTYAGCGAGSGCP